MVLIRQLRNSRTRIASKLKTKTRVNHPPFSPTLLHPLHAPSNYHAAVPATLHPPPPSPLSPCIPISFYHLSGCASSECAPPSCYCGSCSNLIHAFYTTPHQYNLRVVEESMFKKRWDCLAFWAVTIEWRGDRTYMALIVGSSLISAFLSPALSYFYPIALMCNVRTVPLVQ